MHLGILLVLFVDNARERIYLLAELELFCTKVIVLNDDESIFVAVEGIVNHERLTTVVLQWGEMKRDQGIL